MDRGHKVDSYPYYFTINTQQEHARMKKEDMSLQQLERRKYFIQKLIAAGWEAGGWNELFENGADLEPEAQAEYISELFQFRIAIYAPNEYIVLECESRDESGGFSLYLFYDNNIRRVLEEIIAYQNSLSRKNYLELIRELTSLCDEVLLHNGDGLVKVSPII